MRTEAFEARAHDCHEAGFVRPHTQYPTHKTQNLIHSYSSSPADEDALASTPRATSWAL